jgi:hypothetical protein
LAVGGGSSGRGSVADAFGDHGVSMRAQHRPDQLDRWRYLGAANVDEVVEPSGLPQPRNSACRKLRKPRGNRIELAGNIGHLAD